MPDSDAGFRCRKSTSAGGAYLLVYHRHMTLSRCGRLQPSPSGYAEWWNDCALAGNGGNFLCRPALPSTEGVYRTANHFPPLGFPLPRSAGPLPSVWLLVRESHSSLHAPSLRPVVRSCVGRGCGGYPRAGPGVLIGCIKERGSDPRPAISTPTPGAAPRRARARPPRGVSTRGRVPGRRAARRLI